MRELQSTCPINLEIIEKCVVERRGGRDVCSRMGKNPDQAVDGVLLLCYPHPLSTQYFTHYDLQWLILFFSGQNRRSSFFALGS